MRASVRKVNGQWQARIHEDGYVTVFANFSTWGQAWGVLPYYFKFVRKSI